MHEPRAHKNLPNVILQAKPVSPDRKLFYTSVASGQPAWPGSLVLLPFGFKERQPVVQCSPPPPVLKPPSEEQGFEARYKRIGNGVLGSRKDNRSLSNTTPGESGM